MNSLIVALLATQITAAGVNINKEDVTYFEIAEQAIFNCPTYKKGPANIRPTVVFDLIGIERKFNVPTHMKGMLLAHACTHGSLAGDVKTLRYWKTKNILEKKKDILSISPPQKLIRFNRFHYQKAADIWMRRVIKELPKTKKKCAKFDESCSWLNAWLGSVKNFKKVPKKEVKLLRKWHKRIEKNRQTKNHVACGC